MTAYRTVATILVLNLVSCVPGDAPTTPPSITEPDGAPAAIRGGERLGRALVSARHIPGMQALLVAQDGEFLRERYYNGSTPESVYDVKSVTKSVISALVGIAIEEGVLESVDQPLSDVLGTVVDSLDEDWARVTIGNLLTMTAGHSVDANGNSGDLFNVNPLAAILGTPVTHEPGTRFVYSNASTHLLSVILTEAAGMSTAEFARIFLFEPLGWEARPWLADEMGYTIGPWGLHLSARNMLDLGMLYLHAGRSGDDQVIPAEWIEETTQPWVSLPEFGSGLTRGISAYGYLWWLGRTGGHDHHSARGFGGQYIFIVPDLDLVVVSICDYRGKDVEEIHADDASILDLIVEEIIPAVG
ncbi:MAG: serine hydrolase [Gemmatimonadales bacterium]|nr:serine hydrolase [Gemmatimonadales bacterium]NIN13185.1 serine hydrolase [Gemmatimonadales bacterium]NIN51463.1 serine hydrolase [Gemmatimonadales bacterium]NIP08927.1 serine hydrolase [Gemmatimonadales bacterium]NIR03715.1 serine hydrolase [Gemmatimonadales bacterium]